MSNKIKNIAEMQEILNTTAEGTLSYLLDPSYTGSTVRLDHTLNHNGDVSLNILFKPHQELETAYPLNINANGDITLTGTTRDGKKLGNFNTIGDLNSENGSIKTDFAVQGNVHAPNGNINLKELLRTTQDMSIKGQNVIIDNIYTDGRRSTINITADEAVIINNVNSRTLENVHINSSVLVLPKSKDSEMPIIPPKEFKGTLIYADEVQMKNLQAAKDGNEVKAILSDIEKTTITKDTGTTHGLPIQNAKHTRDSSVRV